MISDIIPEIKFIVCKIPPLLVFSQLFFQCKCYFVPVAMASVWHLPLLLFRTFLQLGVTSLWVHRIKWYVFGEQYLHWFCTMFALSTTSFWKMMQIREAYFVATYDDITVEESHVSHNDIQWLYSALFLKIYCKALSILLWVAINQWIFVL